MKLFYDPTGSWRVILDQLLKKIQQTPSFSLLSLQKKKFSIHSETKQDGFSAVTLSLDCR
jgi:hypothetical protein